MGIKLNGKKNGAQGRFEIKKYKEKIETLEIFRIRRKKVQNGNAGEDWKYRYKSELEKWIATSGKN